MALVPLTSKSNARSSNASAEKRARAAKRAVGEVFMTEQPRVPRCASHNESQFLIILFGTMIC